jgi:hypothetical protein
MWLAWESREMLGGGRRETETNLGSVARGGRLRHGDGLAEQLDEAVSCSALPHLSPSLPLGFSSLGNFFSPAACALE